MRLPSLAQELRRRCATTLFYVVGDARALPWHPQQEQNRHPPIFAPSGRCQTGRSPLPIFFLLPLTRSRRRAGVHAQSLRRTRNLKERDYE
jgi:hypothetical protein